MPNIQDNDTTQSNSPIETSTPIQPDLDTNLQNNNSIGTGRTNMGKLELLEERVVVNKERLDVGKIVATKHVRTKTVNVPIELVEEVLTISTEYFDADSKVLLEGNYEDQEVIRHMEPTLENVTSININGKKMTLGEDPVDIVLSRQTAIVKKETHVVQEVNIDKSVHTHADTIEVALQHEELDVVEEGLLAHENIEGKSR